MPGVLSHVSVAVAGFVVIWLLSNWKYGFGFFVGTLIPDSIKFGIPAIRLQTASFAKMMTDPLYGPLHVYTHSVWTWVALCVFVVFVGFLLFRVRWVSWERFRIWVFINVSFLVAIVIHLIMDHFIIEKSFWT
ncbi:hypothetical protein KAT36_00055 [Candidatus Pacearchaeota archaeon]|nr:hypothetical protein [Candidatus Pacearchaeota archaeon]